MLAFYTLWETGKLKDHIRFPATPLHAAAEQHVIQAIQGNPQTMDISSAAILSPAAFLVV